MRGASRLGVVVVTALVLLIGIAVFLRRVSSERHRTTAPADAPVVADATQPKAPTVRRTPVWRADDDDDGKPAEDQVYKSGDPASPEVDTAKQWGRIDFDEI